MHAASREWILEAEDGVRLYSMLSVAPKRQARGLIILIHGWEGCHDSIYLQSAAGRLFAEGFDVLRLNLRDHGPSHHLNEGLFHAQRLDEVVSVLQRVMAQMDYASFGLVGFSLGGNFALRVAERWIDPPTSKTLDQVAAICPVFDPLATFHAMERGPAVYRHYFLRKWKRSLSRKQQCFPDLLNREELDGLNDLSSLTEYLVSRFTPYETRYEYFDSYTLRPELLEQIARPSHILIASDDPVIPIDSVFEVTNPRVSMQVSRHGGHCGFITNYRLESFVDDYLVRCFAQL